MDQLEKTLTVESWTLNVWTINLTTENQFSTKNSYFPSVAIRYLLPLSPLLFKFIPRDAFPWWMSKAISLPQDFDLEYHCMQWMVPAPSTISASWSKLHSCCTREFQEMPENSKRKDLGTFPSRSLWPIGKEVAFNQGLGEKNDARGKRRCHFLEHENTRCLTAWSTFSS